MHACVFVERERGREGEGDRERERERERYRERERDRETERQRETYLDIGADLREPDQVRTAFEDACKDIIYIYEKILYIYIYTRRTLTRL